MTRIRVAALLLLLVLTVTAGCAARTRLVTVGRMYLVQWPGTQGDIVEIHRTWPNGWAQCRSVADRVIWMCNLNTATFFVEVVRGESQRGPAVSPPPAAIRAGR